MRKENADYNQGFAAGYEQAIGEINVDKAKIAFEATNDAIKRLWECVNYYLEDMKFDEVDALFGDENRVDWWKIDPQKFMSIVEQHKAFIDGTQWIRRDKDEWYDYQGQCPVCGHITIDCKNFCPNCGKKLRLK